LCIITIGITSSIAHRHRRHRQHQRRLRHPWLPFNFLKIKNINYFFGNGRTGVGVDRTKNKCSDDSGICQELQNDDSGSIITCKT
jgi:hypothetical protein